MSLLSQAKTRYHVYDPDEGILHNLTQRLTSRGVPKFPRTIQIQTQTGCNAACVFCPYPDSVNEVPKGKMSDELFDKIVNEIAQFGVTTRISPYLMNEPFLDKDLVNRARTIKKKIPRARVVVTTNADPLKKQIVDDIIRDNPFRRFFVSFQGIQKEAYEKTMKGALVMEKTMANVDYLIEQRNKHLPDLDIVITMVKTNLVDADAAVAFWRARGVDAKYTALENRGGNIQIFDNLTTGPKRIFKDCTRLFKQAYILWNGDLVLCCTDYYKKIILGNCADSSVYDVWNSPRAVDIRRKFIKGDMTENSLCANCEIAADIPVE